MKITELIRYSRRLIKGRRTRTMMICMLPLGSELLFRFAEAAVYSLLLYFGSMSPIVLFSGSNKLQLAVSLVFSIMRIIVTAPLSYAAAFRLCEICCEAPKKRIVPVTRLLMNRRTFKRSAAAAVWTRIFSMLALVPAAFFGITAYSLMKRGLDARGVFMAVHAAVLTIVSVILWISLKISLSAVPYLLVKFPEKSVFRTVLSSLRLMSGRKAALFRLAAVYIPPMLTIIALPFAFTELMTAFALSIDIFIKEDEYLEGNKASVGIGKADDSASLSLREKRRLTAAAHKAETAGKRYNKKRDNHKKHRYGVLRRRNNTETY